MIASLPDLPTRVLVDHDGTGRVSNQRQGARFTTSEGVVDFVGSSVGLAVRVACPAGLLSRVVLRLETAFPGRSGNR
jgi:hypothetical protein